MKVEYKVNDQNWSLTQCPHKDFVLKIGSIECQKCIYWFGQNHRDHYVHCMNQNKTK